MFGTARWEFPDNNAIDNSCGSQFNKRIIPLAEYVVLKSLYLISLTLILASCVMPEDDGIPRIRSQRDIAAYNATITDPSQELVCTREVVVGTNFRPYVCLTVAQMRKREEQDQLRVNDVFSRVGTGPSVEDR